MLWLGCRPTKLSYVGQNRRLYRQVKKCFVNTKLCRCWGMLCSSSPELSAISGYFPGLNSSTAWYLTFGTYMPWYLYLIVLWHCNILVHSPKLLKKIKYFSSTEQLRLRSLDKVISNINAQGLLHQFLKNNHAFYGLPKEISSNLSD